MKLSSTWLALGLLTGLTAANTCADVKSVAPSIKISYKLQPSYFETSNEYWSTACANLSPSCIIYPQSPYDVAAILKVLGRKDNTERFAVKSGGHNSNLEWSSVKDGPLISTEKLNHVILDPDTGVVRLGPGNRWDDVADALDGSGWSVVGGRIGNVGVGGYMLGCGLSFMSAQYGWASSSLIEVELVTANGTIITASAHNHPDIFLAIKGGGNNFGVITSYTVQAYRQGLIYGGVVSFARTPETDAAMLAAIEEFARNSSDEKAAIIPTAEIAGAGLLDIWIVFFFYDGPTPPKDTFAKFDAIPNINYGRKTQSMASYLKANNLYVLKGSVYLIGTETLPLPPDANSDSARDFLPAIHAHWRNVTNARKLVPGVIGSIAFQPFPRRIAKLARAMGGDLVDFDDNIDRIIIELDFSFYFRSDYDKMSKAMEETFGGMRTIVKERQSQGTLPDAYLPLFANDAFHTQDYWGRIRPKSHALAKSLAAELDPNHLFRDRTGGWKP